MKLYKGYENKKDENLIPIYHMKKKKKIKPCFEQPFAKNAETKTEKGVDKK